MLLPGRESRLGEPPMTNASAMMDAFLAASRDPFDRPYAIFGHSMGALLAYRLAWGLQEAGMRAPICLIVSGRDAPQTVYSHGPLHGLGDEEFLAALGDRYGGMPLLEDAEMREIFLPILRADLTVVETFVMPDRAELTCPVVALAGVEDGSVSESGLRAWGEVTAGEFAARRLPGGHFYHFGVGEAELMGVIPGCLGG